LTSRPADPRYGIFHTQQTTSLETTMTLAPAINVTPELPVRLTEAAATKLGEFLAGETGAAGLRVYVYSGGCSGYRYGMMLEDAPTEADQVLENRGRRIYVDKASLPLLAGSEIDYVDTLMGAGFTVNNPNAVSGCGCGSSFRTADDAGSARSCSH
jgi:iron-sulfur cluster assembly accessory protein